LEDGGRAVVSVRKSGTYGEESARTEDESGGCTEVAHKQSSTVLNSGKARRKVGSAFACPAVSRSSASSFSALLFLFAATLNVASHPAPCLSLLLCPSTSFDNANGKRRQRCRNGPPREKWKNQRLTGGTVGQKKKAQCCSPSRSSDAMRFTRRRSDASFTILEGYLGRRKE
jgi:hypothetical protein